ncbi:TIGR03747 family integrating conjugative element membrane protein [Xenorhabdus bovienii]|uniref:TIGR03747 family integrating conjugative element membrane protein n=3 Tax=Xenorhabdus TaxID=626 RepID=A0AAJ1J7H7_XENBV|nr:MULTISPECIES: TIGR03747 family integrating conjugative element membrane protein [Xenorhabdus]MDC9622453.1 TIGR03747 family integrating conjugative element membrane protein [Xenorhabdus aichiensis]MDE1476848.1 TIGR03747 family integrating conjugative element membrane protein [Xenorhabdus bovienii]MDE1486250.1 TIGR03747 family integrating conjugative element membrane protein [Xenorhabdus bovienii]MDE1496560.1 TIGR03747 family integrating conjugative element membrane protein [Xenorhabdus bovien
MAQSENQSRQPSQPPRQHGLLYCVLWEWPWQIAGFIVMSWLFSLLLEYLGMTFCWPEQGASHSQTMMKTELQFLSTEFTQSLLLSNPAQTVSDWLAQIYNWLFVDSGFMHWIQGQRQYQLNSRNDFLREFNTVLQGVSGYLQQYGLATVFITMVTLIRIAILVLSVPLFVMVFLVALVDGLGRRDLRRYGAGYESSFVYHHAKRGIKPACTIPCVLYLSWPDVVYPTMILLPAAIILGIVVMVTTSMFKKYL